MSVWKWRWRRCIFCSLVALSILRKNTWLFPLEQHSFGLWAFSFKYLQQKKEREKEGSNSIIEKLWFCWRYCLESWKHRSSNLRRLDFFLLLVLQSWRMSCTYRRAQEEGKRDARTALAMSALQLSDSMTKKTTAFVTPHFQAWVPLATLFISFFFAA